MDILAHPAFPTFAVTSCYLVVLMMIVGHWTGALRFTEKQIINPEDTRIAPMVDDVEIGSQEAAKVDRYLRNHRNHLESTLPFFIVGVLYLASNPSLAMAQGLFVAFVVFRTLFTVFYSSQIQPWRSMSFLAGEICILVMIVAIVRWAW